MCYGCLTDDYELTDEQITELSHRPNVTALAADIAAYYRLPECETGGPIHAVVDDMNVEDEHLELFDPTTIGFPPDPPEVVDAAEKIIEKLKPMSIPERAVACWYAGVLQ